MNNIFANLEPCTPSSPCTKSCHTTGWGSCHFRTPEGKHSHQGITQTKESPSRCTEPWCPLVSAAKNSPPCLSDKVAHSVGTLYPHQPVITGFQGQGPLLTWHHNHENHPSFSAWLPGSTFRMIMVDSYTHLSL